MSILVLMGKRLVALLSLSFWCLLMVVWLFLAVPWVHTGQCKSTGSCYNELVVAFFSTGGGVKVKKIYTC